MWGSPARSGRHRVPRRLAAEGVERLIRQGCYRCLEQAFAEAEARGAATQAFEAAALLVLRSKELGLPTEPWLGHARSRAAADPSLTPYLTMVEAIPPHAMSDDRDALFDVRSRSQARSSLQAWRDSLHSGATSNVFRMYLDVALICGFGTLKEDDQSFSGQLDADVRSPIYQYRVGVCDSAHRQRLRTLRASDGAYVDADFALGRYALDDPAQSRPGRSPVATAVGVRGVSAIARDRRHHGQCLSPLGGMVRRAHRV